MENTKPVIIFDTDMDTDCDDAGALAILLEYAKKDKADVAAIVTDCPDKYAPTACELICNWYGYRPMIGTIYDDEFPETDTDRYVRYRAHRKTLPEDIYYNRTTSRLLGKTDADYPSSVEVYRKTLSSAADHSVIVLAVGFMTAIEQLWRSPADSFSDLDGFELFRKKVAFVVSMGDATYPSSDNYNFNYNMDREGAKVFFDRCPCPVYVSPDGMDVITGSSFSQFLSPGHPLRMIYEIYNQGPNRGRMSWDLIALLFALEPSSPLFKLESHGTVRYDDSCNVVYWEENGPRKDYQVTSTIPSTEMAGLLDKIMLGKASLTE
ncbi:MAG: nucleoside hydrolase [Oscillospiraceae bacterium]|nr:nucleoside hydrolase [Oscillospiraceae bacterium]MBR3001515.1 nucleoside hydrolase [Oscillospiraceae bacterium]